MIRRNRRMHGTASGVVSVLVSLDTHAFTMAIGRVTRAMRALSTARPQLIHNGRKPR